MPEKVVRCKNGDVSDFKTQKAIKPRIEDVAKELKSKNDLNNLLDFLEFLKENKLAPRWQSSNTWIVRYKNKRVCNLRINYREDGWRISNNQFIHEKWFENSNKYPLDIELKDFILDNISAPGCLSKTDCKGIENITVLGKHFDAICNCWPFSIKNPSGTKLEYLKKLFLAIKDYTPD
jgi:hypothetical protein